MAQVRDFSVLTSLPTTPRSTVVGLYANASGTINQINSAGAILYIGGQLTGTVPITSIRTGGAGTMSTGVIYSAITTAAQTGLGQPSFFIPYLGPDNVMYGVPAYPYK